MRERTARPGEYEAAYDKESYSYSRSFVLAYQSSLKVQDQLAHNRIRLSQRLNEMSDELLALAREGEKMRKQVNGACGGMEVT